MAERLWLTLTLRERAILQEALSAYAGSKYPDNRGIKALSNKLRRAASHPDITIGVWLGYDEKKSLDEVQKITDNHIKHIDDLQKKKDGELLGK